MKNESVFVSKMKLKKIIEDKYNSLHFFDAMWNDIKMASTSDVKKEDSLNILTKEEIDLIKQIKSANSFYDEMMLSLNADNNTLSMISEIEDNLSSILIDNLVERINIDYFEEDVKRWE